MQCATWDSSSVKVSCISRICTHMQTNLKSKANFTSAKNSCKLYLNKVCWQRVKEGMATIMHSIPTTDFTSESVVSVAILHLCLYIVLWSIQVTQALI